MARLNGSSASIPARQRGFRLPLLLKLFGSQSCGHRPAAGHAQLAAGALEPVRAGGEGLSGLARADRPRRHVAARRGAGTLYWQHARMIGHAAMVRRMATSPICSVGGRATRARGQRASIGVRFVDGLALNLAYECIG